PGFIAAGAERIDIVADHHLAVFGEVNIGFDDLLAVLPGQLKSGQGVFRRNIGLAAMRREEGLAVLRAERGTASQQYQEAYFGHAGSISTGVGSCKSIDAEEF